MDRKKIQQQFGLIGESAGMVQLVDKVMQVAPTGITVLLQGESGVGKDVTARALHGLSKRKDRNLVIVNCGAIPEGIIESELFGHERGSFTGAEVSRQGYFEKANGGTIFLDEIGDTPKSVQVKLLRILENGEYFRVGSADIRKTDVRIIAATNRDLWKDVENGTFREDLFYRLNTVTIRIPSLRERPEDILPIFRQFVLDYSTKYDSIFQGFSDDARQLLAAYRWPGNVRELRNVAEQLVVLEKSQFITADNLQKYLKGRQHMGATDHLPIRQHTDTRHTGHEDALTLVYRTLVELRTDMADLKKMIGGVMYGQVATVDVSRMLPPAVTSGSPNVDLGARHHLALEVRVPDAVDPFDGKDLPTLEEAEKLLISKALDRFEGNRRKSADALGISERTLYRKIDQYDLDA